MNELEIRRVMTFVFAEAGTTLTAERLAVWAQMLKDVPLDVGMTAAKVVVARAQFPGKTNINDMLRAIAEVTTPKDERETWGEAWDKWVLISRRLGSYRFDRCVKRFALVSPRGAAALGSSAREYFRISIDDMGTFRAQFRQRYEALATRSNHERALPADLRVALGYEPRQAKVLPMSKDLEPASDVVKRLSGE